MLNSDKYLLIENELRAAAVVEDGIPTLTPELANKIIDVVMKASKGTENPKPLFNQIQDSYWRMYG